MIPHLAVCDYVTSVKSLCKYRQITFCNCLGMVESSHRYAWGIIALDPSLSLKYLSSPFALEIAQTLKCGRYLALILNFYSDFDDDYVWLAYVVSPAPQTSPFSSRFLPISPFQHGNYPPLDPCFSWPFEDCVVDMTPVCFKPVFSFADRPSHGLLDQEASRFAANLKGSHPLKFAEYLTAIRAEHVAAGFSDKSISVWSRFSSNSSGKGAVMFPPPPPVAHLYYNLSLISEVPPGQTFHDEIKAIEKCVPAYSHLAGTHPSSQNTQSFCAPLDGKNCRLGHIVSSGNI